LVERLIFLKGNKKEIRVEKWACVPLSDKIRDTYHKIFVVIVLCPPKKRLRSDVSQMFESGNVDPILLWKSEGVAMAV
jgi:hypothetical protein